MQPQAFGSEFEGLEDRLLMAGNITSVLAGGVLTLTGDAAANQVQITVGSNGQMIAKGLTGTTINGLASVNFGVVNTLSVLGGLGDDKIELNHSGATIANDVTLNGEAGNDTITATGKFGADLNLIGDLGNDTLRVANAQVSRTGSTLTDVTMNGGDGNDTVSITGSTVGNDVFLIAGLGNDKVTASGLNITDDLSLTDGNGVNSIHISNVNTRDDLSVVLGAGNDQMTINNVTSLGKIDIALGDGTNQLTLTNSRAFGTTQGITVGLTTPGDGILVVSGAGIDKIGIHQSETSGQILVDSGAGSDRVELIQTKTTRRQGTLDVTTGGGADIVTLDRVRIGGDIAIDTGAQNDIFTVKNSEFIGDFVADLADGDDTAFAGGNVFGTSIIYTIDAGITGEVRGDTLHLGVNSPFDAGFYPFFELIVPILR